MPEARASRAVIVAAGSELLTPERIDTNSLTITRRLNEMGVDVRYKTVVGDDREDLAAAVRAAIPQADVIVITGGLGPTDDDVTREAVASVFDMPLEENADLARAIRSRFEARGAPMPGVNRRQALVPRGAVTLPNERGTAPGLWIEQAGVVCVALPGPPRELGPMFDRVARDRIAPLTGGNGVHRRVIRVAGRTESHVEEAACPVYSRWRSDPVPIETSILASLGQVELHLSVRGEAEGAALRALDRAADQLAELLGRDLVSSDGSRLEEVVGRLLRERGRRVAVAESCTGGLVASRLTDVPGSSAYFDAGWVVYGNGAKVALLGVDGSAIERHGAVSEPVARMMAIGARDRGGADYGIGITGVAGPGGGAPDKPVGTVFVALAGPDGAMRVRRLRLPGEREQVKRQASHAALDLLRRALLR